MCKFKSAIQWQRPTLFIDTMHAFMLGMIDPHLVFIA